MGLRAIDLYSGIGGWTLGLEAAGIKVVKSYEWWSPAVATYEKNFKRKVQEKDIRKLISDDLPRNIQVVVGSPPCTQFSYSNRGGNGNLKEGIRDIEAFLAIVALIKPRYWVMENVPRVGAILESALRSSALSEYSNLVSTITVVDASEFGVPQRRKRMLAGNFPLDLLLEYREGSKRRTLGDVVRRLSAKRASDPVFGGAISRKRLTEMDLEPFLDEEELRLNREAKLYHPVYNTMPFPEPLDKPSRTITAVCTRVSRESIVIKEAEAKQFRRLTIRERASLQSFPVTYQFNGQSYTQKTKLIGNAMPPLLAFHLGAAMQGVPSAALSPPRASNLPVTIQMNGPTRTAKSVSYRRQVPKNRSFRAALPNLRFGSGNRFELVNKVNETTVMWYSSFFYGPSKSFRTIRLDKRALETVKRSGAWGSIRSSFEAERERFVSITENLTARDLQDSWERRRAGLKPFDIADQLGGWAARTAHELSALEGDLLEKIFVRLFSRSQVVGRQELRKASGTSNGHISKNLADQKARVVAGIATCAWFNSYSQLSRKSRRV